MLNARRVGAKYIGESGGSFVTFSYICALTPK